MSNNDLREHRGKLFGKKSMIETDTLAVVQIIATGWHKDFRGGPDAQLRNEVPEAAPLAVPETPIREPSFLVHTSEHRFYRRHFSRMLARERLPQKLVEIMPTTEAQKFGCLSIRLDGAALHVDYSWDYAAGVPKRLARHDVLHLERGQWGRVRWNERHSAYNLVPRTDASYWWYEKWVLNIGLFANFEPGVFVDTLPVKVVSMMDRLR